MNREMPPPPAPCGAKGDREEEGHDETSTTSTTTSSSMPPPKSYRINSEPVITIISCDGIRFNLGPTILQYLTKFKADIPRIFESKRTLRLPTVRGIVLEKILDWCKVYFDYFDAPYDVGSNRTSRQDLTVWWTSFFDVHQNLFQDLYDAAKYLRCTKFLAAMRNEVGGPVAQMMIEERSLREMTYFS